MDQFREVLDAWLAQPEMSQAELARRSGLPQTVISRWAGRNPTKPSPRNLQKLAPILDVPYEDLMRMCGYLPQLPADVNHGHDKSRAEKVLVRRQQSQRQELERWLAVLGPQMGPEAAEEYFWKTRKQSTDAVLDLYARIQGAVNDRDPGAVKRDVGRDPSLEDQSEDNGNSQLPRREHAVQRRMRTGRPEPKRRALAHAA